MPFAHPFLMDTHLAPGSGLSASGANFANHGVGVSIRLQCSLVYSSDSRKECSVCSQLPWRAYTKSTRKYRLSRQHQATQCAPAAPSQMCQVTVSGCAVLEAHRRGVAPSSARVSCGAVAQPKAPQMDHSDVGRAGVHDYQRIVLEDEATRRRCAAR